MIIPEGFIRSVVCIGDIKSDNFIPMGTGFFGWEKNRQKGRWLVPLFSN